MNPKWHFFTGLFISLLIAVPAAAYSPIDKQAALDDDFRTLIGHARDAFDASDYEAAIEYLVIANHLEDEPRLFHNIARSHEELGNCHKSLAYYRAFLEDPPDDEALIERAQNTIEERGPDCDEYHDELGGRLVIASTPKLATVYLDEEPLGLAPTETAGLEPGTYALRFEFDGHEDYTTEVEVVANESLQVTATLEEATEEEDEADSVEPVAQTDISDDTDDEFRPNPIALGLVGAGAAGAITGAVFDLVLIPGIDEERDQARADSQQQQVNELTEQRDRYATIAVAGYITGAVIGLGGLAWIGYDYYHYSDDSDDDPGFGFRITPELGPTQTGFSLTGWF